MPIEQRRKYSLYQNMSEKIIKNSFYVPLQDTMYGLDLDASFWSDARKAQQKKELLALDSFRLNQNGIYHNRYYSDFDMWLRAKPQWKDKASELLLSSDTLITEFLDKSHIKKTFNDHMSAKKSYHANLIKWMSIEMFLRQTKFNE